MLIAAWLSPANSTESNISDDADIESKTSGAKVRSEKPFREGYSWNFEQDLLVINKGLNEDRDYTQGTSIEWFGKRINDSYFFNYPLNKIDEFTDRILDINFENEVADSMTLGLKAYTPLDISDPDPIHYDRPYASYFYLTDSRTREFIENENVEDKTHKKYLRTSFTLASLGNNLGEDFQFMVHQLQNNDDIPQGWSNQVSEPVVFNYQITRLDNFHKNKISGLNVDYGTHLGGDIGTIFLDVFGGAGFRIGKFNSSLVSLPGIDQSKKVDLNTFDMKSYKGKSCKWFYECFFYLSTTLKYVYSNKLIEGFAGDNVRYSRDDLEPWVGLASAGISVQWTKHFTLTIAQHVKTSEFFSADPRYDSDRKHYYGGIYLSVDNPLD